MNKFPGFRILNAVLAGGMATALLGCDPAPPPSSTSPTTSATPSGGTAAKDETKPATTAPPSLQAPLPALTGGTDTSNQPAAIIKLPEFDTSKVPAPVRTKYAELKRVFETTGDPLDAALTIAAIHYVHGNAADAAKIGEQVVAARPNLVAIQHMVGLYFEKAGENAKAIAAFQKASEIDPAFPAPYVRLGILSLDKDPARAMAAFRKACELSPEDSRPFLGVAKALKAGGKNEDAYKMVQESLARFPNYAEAHRDGAALSKALGKPEDAARHEQRAGLGGLPPNPDQLLTQILLFGLDLRTVVQTAVGLAQQGNIKDAETMLMTAIPLDTQGTMARRAMASVKTVSGKLDDSVSILRSLIESDPKDVAAIFQLGDVLAKQAKYAEAIEQFKKATELAPQDPRVPHLMALAYLRLDQLDDAKAAWESALRIAPTLDEAYTGLVQVAVLRKDYETAIRVLRDGLTKSPESPVLSNGLAWYLATQPNDKLRNGAEAVKLAEAAVKATGEQTHEFLDTLACAFAEMGRFDDAKATCAKAIKLATEAKNDELLGQYKSRLATFEQKKPFRDELK